MTKITWPQLLLAGLICLLVVAVLYYPVFFKGMVAVNGSDAYLHFLSHLRHMADSYKQGRFPLWNPLGNLGYTIPSTGPGTLPLNYAIPLYMLLPPWWAHSVMVLFNLWCAFFFSWLYLRSIGFGNLAAVSGCLAYCLCGPVFYLHSYFLMLGPAFLPIVLSALSFWDRTKKPLFLIGFAVSFLILGQSLVTALPNVTIAVIFHRLVHMWQIKRLKAPPPRGRYLLLWLGILGCGILVRAIYMAPLIEWMRLSSRSLLAFIPNKLPGAGDIINAVFFGKFLNSESLAGHYHYIGMGTLTLATVGLLRAHKRPVVFYFFLLSLFFPLEYLISRLLYALRMPFLSSMDHWRGMFVFTFALAQLVAQGTESLIKPQALPRFNLLSRRIVLGIMLALLLITGGKLAFRHLHGFCYRKKQDIKLTVAMYDILAKYLNADFGRGRLAQYGHLRAEPAILSKVRLLPTYSNFYNAQLEQALEEDQLLDKKSTAGSIYLWSLRNPDAKKLTLYGVHYLIMDNRTQIPERFRAGWRRMSGNALLDAINLWENIYYHGRAYVISAENKLKDIPVLVEDVSDTEVHCEITAAAAVAAAAADTTDRLILADQAYPGWQAFVNGQVISWQPFRRCFRSVGLPAGNSTVIWRYKSRTHIFGLWISLVGAGGFVILLYQVYRNEKNL